MEQKIEAPNDDDVETIATRIVHARQLCSTITGEGSASNWDKLLDLMGFAGGGVDPASSDRDRAERVDKELADAGIHPGDPQLYGEHELQTDADR